MTANAIIDFDAPLDRFAQALGISMQTVVRRVSLELLTGIVQRTPVDTGRAQSGWDLTIEEPSSYVPPEGGGAEAVAPAPDLTGITGHEQVYIVNNLDYIEALENGHSDQAPAGMVRITVAESAARIELYLEALEP